LKRMTKRAKLLAAFTVAAGVIFVFAVAGATPRSFSPYSKLAIFARVLSHLERLYVEPIDEDEVILGAIRGMMRTLDPHSDFLDPEKFQMLEADTTGRFGGIGVEVGVRGDVLTVIVAMPDTPAERAGVQPGDQIVAIEGKSTINMSLDDVVRLMRGEPGTKVTITLQRLGESEPFDITVTREIVKVESVTAELLEPGFPWLQVRAFQDGTTEEVAEAIERFERESGGLKGIVLDLRRNPGGMLDEAVRLSDLFVSSGTIVTTRGRDGDILQEFKARKHGTIQNTPLVALIDGASASEAEIVAGALKDQGRALLVGTRSFGKGSVQSIIDLGDGFGLKLTVARYFTPSGKSIQVEGVVPDVFIESKKAPEPDEETAMINSLPGEEDLPGHLNPGAPVPEEDKKIDIDDYQLRIAFQLLRGLARAELAKNKKQ
jgi:carboxyl-terminal processing protease